MQNIMCQSLLFQQKAMFKLSKLSSKGFKRTACWNEYKVIGYKIVEIANNNEEKYIRKLLDSSRQGVKRLFALAYNNEEGDNKVSVDSYKKCFLPRVKIQNYKIEIDGKNFMMNQLMIQLNNMTKSEKNQHEKVMITQLAIY